MRASRRIVPRRLSVVTQHSSCSSDSTSNLFRAYDIPKAAVIEPGELLSPHYPVGRSDATSQHRTTYT